MGEDIRIWIEQLSALHHNLMRKAASAEGLQLVHFEILQYLSLCNRYSNTAQAISDYLGQTKGSISQSLHFLEDRGYISRQVDPADKRYVRLSLTPEGHECVRRMAENGVPPPFPESAQMAVMLKTLLALWQRTNGARGFGQCQSCKHNQSLSGGRFRCGLTGEMLAQGETRQICREWIER